MNSTRTPTSLAPPPSACGDLSPTGMDQTRLIICYVLRTGVMISGTLMILGLALYLARGPAILLNFSRFEPASSDGGFAYNQPRAVWRGLIHDLDPVACMQAGVLILLCTPLARVFVTLILFLRMRDWIYVTAAAIVLAMLLASMAGPALYGHTP